MKKIGSEKSPRRYAYFTEEQQSAYESLNSRQRLYVDYRGQGNGKKDSYIMAGYDGKSAAQASFVMEKNNPIISSLIETISAHRNAYDLTVENSKINKRIDALASQDGAEKILEVIDGADGETAKRIKFYRDIISGKIKTTKKTTRYNNRGGIIDTKVEEYSDVDIKIKARKELDRLLGINQLPDLGQLQMGDITINIVDASKKDELEDSRNSIDLNVDKVQVINGEEFIVENEQVINDGKKPKAMEDLSMSENVGE